MRWLVLKLSPNRRSSRPTVSVCWGGPSLTRSRLKGPHGGARTAGSPATTSRARLACTVGHRALTTARAEQRPQLS